MNNTQGEVDDVSWNLDRKLRHRPARETEIPSRRGHGKANEADYLKALGAALIIDRSELSLPGKPLQKERWAGVVDSVGSHTLANAGVSLLGIDSVMAPREPREKAWVRLARDLDSAALDRVSTAIGLEQALRAAEDIVAGKIRGRVVVDVNR